MLARLVRCTHILALPAIRLCELPRCACKPFAPGLEVRRGDLCAVTRLVLLGTQHERTIWLDQAEPRDIHGCGERAPQALRLDDLGLEFLLSASPLLQDVRGPCRRGASRRRRGARACC